VNLDDVKKEIEDLGYTVTNIWNIKKQGTKKALHMFYVELKLKSNNKDIYEIGSFLDYKVKFEPRIPNMRFLNTLITKCYGKNFCFRKPRCARDYPTIHPFIHAGRNAKMLNAC